MFDCLDSPKNERPNQIELFFDGERPELAYQERPDRDAG
jgi:hypothetical protein